MVSVPVSSVEDCVFDLGRVILLTMKLVFIASPLITQYYGVRATIGSLGIGISMCPSGEKLLPADRFFSELTL